MNLADIGLESAGFRVGVFPTDVFGKMRQLQASASPLDADIRAKGSESLKNAWDDWYRRWRAFYDKYAPDDPWANQSAKLSVALHTAEVDAEVEGWRKQFAHFYDRYRAESGQVPTGPGAPLVAPPPPPPTTNGTAISWWTIGLVGGGILAVGLAAYWFYVQSQNLKRSRQALTNLLPEAIPGRLGEAAYEAQTGERPPSRDCRACGRPVL